MGQHPGGNLPLVFLGLRDTVFCTECELLSHNHTPRCLACGSVAVLSLSRVLGGSLRGQSTARLITDEEIHTAVGKVVGWTESFIEHNPTALPVATARTPPTEEHALRQRNRILFPALEAGVRCCCELTGGTGAAVAVSEGSTMVCRARAGTTAPDLELEVPDTGLTALAIRSRRLWCCNDTESEPWANQSACRTLGIRSMVIAPIVVPKQVLGVLEVFSPSPWAFDDYHSAAVQLIASALAVAILRCGSQNRPPRVGALLAPDEVQLQISAQSGVSSDS
jgi:GAF domain-containing protein